MAVTFPVGVAITFYCG